MQWLVEQMSAGWTVLMHSTRFFAFVVFAMMAAFGAYSAYLHKPGVLDPTAPPPAPPAADPKPAAVTEAISISIHGPQPAVVIDGVSTLFLADTTGPTGTPKWRIVPPDAGTIRKTSADGRRAELSPNGPGKCTLLVDVAGDGRQLATDAIDLEIVTVGEDRADNPARPEPMPPAPPAPPMPQTVAQLVTGALASVNTENRKAEASQVASAIQAVIGRINAGALQPNADPIAEVELHMNQSMGANAGKWNGFTTALDVMIQQLRTQGAITTIATSVPTLNEAAGVLRSSP
jgi:hypothetical protein